VRKINKSAGRVCLPMVRCMKGHNWGDGDGNGKSLNSISHLEILP